MIGIQPQHVTLAQLFQSRLFRIPQYQRSYSWGTKQRQDLFSDIERIHAHGTEQSHFMATIVGLRRQQIIIGTTQHQLVEIVDGQQRITTLILLLKSIAVALKNLDKADASVREEIHASLVKDDNATLLLLQTNHDSSDYFANYLRNGLHPSSAMAKTVADRELLSAIEECERFVSGWTEDGNSIVALVTLLKNRLTFILHEISDESLVYSVFEVLNSRGLEVSWFDRLKSMLMAIVFEKSGNQSEIIDQVHQLWSQIYSCVGLRLGLSTESLRFAATLRSRNCPSRPLSEGDAVNLLVSQSIEGVDQVIETTRWLLDVTRAVDVLAANGTRNAVTRIAQARMVATAINLRQDFSEKKRAKILEKWEKVTFRVYGMFRRDARWAVGDYVRLAWRIVQEKLSCRETIGALSVIGNKFPVEEAVDSLRNVNCYTYWREELRYFLYKYEEHLSKQAGQNFRNEQWNRIWEATSAGSVEHIRPQNWWIERGKESDEGRMHSLGNLLLLPPGLNSKLSDLPPRKKADSYNRTGLLIASDVANSIIASGWTLKKIKEREAELLEWALEEWAD